MLREANCFAARKLRGYGAELANTRAVVAAAGGEGAADGEAITAASATRAAGALGGATPRRRKLEAKVVDAVSSEVLLAIEDLSLLQPMPRIGEAMRIGEAGVRGAAAAESEPGRERLYRVKDIVWMLSAEAAAPGKER